MTRRGVDGRGGFSLLELLIVVAIILILATIAIPSFLRSRQAANESGAVAGLKSVNIAQANYLLSTQGYGTIAQLVADGLLEDRFANQVSGYSLTVIVDPSLQDYEANATALRQNGRYDYYSGPDGVIRYTTTAARAPAGLAGLPVN